MPISFLIVLVVQAIKPNILHAYRSIRERFTLSSSRRSSPRAIVYIVRIVSFDLKLLVRSFLHSCETRVTNVHCWILMWIHGNFEDYFVIDSIDDTFTRVWRDDKSILGSIWRRRMNSSILECYSRISKNMKVEDKIVILIYLKKMYKIDINERCIFF